MELALEQVSKRYPGHPETLRNISFTIPRSVRVALVGPSGAGKSTIASLLRRDSDPTTGRIVLDGRDMRDYQPSSVLRYMGVILQRPEVFSGTVAENILHGLPRDCKVSDNELWEIVDKLGPDLRRRFEREGLSTRIGKQGLQLSEGQKQRLCVMRALIKNPEVLIVDEATSSQDSMTEAIVQETIDATLGRGISALVIAHRLSTLRQCNKFVVLRRLYDCAPDESQVEAVASSMRELMDVSPTFRGLAMAQDFRP